MRTIIQSSRENLAHLGLIFAGMRIRRHWSRLSALVFVGACAAFFLLFRRLPASDIFSKTDAYCPICYGEDFCPSLPEISVPVWHTWLNYRNVYFGEGHTGKGLSRMRLIRALDVSGILTNRFKLILCRYCVEETCNRR